MLRKAIYALERVGTQTAVPVVERFMTKRARGLSKRTRKAVLRDLPDIIRKLLQHTVLVIV